RLPGRSLEIDREISLDFWIDIFNARLQRIEHFAWRNFATAQQRLQVGDIERRQGRPAHSTTLVTMKRLFALRGALLSACSAVNQSRGSSSRKTLNTGMACAAASTWLTSTSRSFAAYFKTSLSCFCNKRVSSPVRFSRASF